jgi:hypothetical protein
MPKSVIWWYKHWLNGYPETYHAYDIGRFYAFVHLLLAHSKKPRYRDWLEANLREDCPRLSEERIKKYGQMYETIQEFATFWRTHYGQQLMQLRQEQRMEAIRHRWERLNNLNESE